jgi:hypothetical protein
MNLVQMSRSLSCFLFMSWELRGRALVYPNESLGPSVAGPESGDPVTATQPPFAGTTRPACGRVRILFST